MIDLFVTQESIDFSKTEFGTKPVHTSLKYIGNIALPSDKKLTYKVLEMKKNVVETYDSIFP